MSEIKWVQQAGLKSAIHEKIQKPEESSHKRKLSENPTL